MVQSSGCWGQSVDCEMTRQSQPVGAISQPKASANARCGVASAQPKALANQPWWRGVCIIRAKIRLVAQAASAVDAPAVQRLSANGRSVGCCAKCFRLGAVSSHTSQGPTNTPSVIPVVNSNTKPVTRAAGVNRAGDVKPRNASTKRPQVAEPKKRGVLPVRVGGFAVHLVHRARQRQRDLRG